MLKESKRGLTPVITIDRDADTMKRLNKWIEPDELKGLFSFLLPRWQYLVQYLNLMENPKVLSASNRKFLINFPYICYFTSKQDRVGSCIAFSIKAFREMTDYEYNCKQFKCYVTGKFKTGYKYGMLFYKLFLFFCIY